MKKCSGQAVRTGERHLLMALGPEQEGLQLHFNRHALAQGVFGQDIQHDFLAVEVLRKNIRVEHAQHGDRCRRVTHGVDQVAQQIELVAEQALEDEIIAQRQPCAGGGFVCRREAETSCVAYLTYIQ